MTHEDLRNTVIRVCLGPCEYLLKVLDARKLELGAVSAITGPEVDPVGRRVPLDLDVARVHRLRLHTKTLGPLGDYRHLLRIYPIRAG